MNLPLCTAPHAAHSLHGPGRIWPESNCYVDLWIQALSSMSCLPEAGLGFTVTQDFEGDQFTFFKFPLEDLRELFGLSVQEISIYQSLERHIENYTDRGDLVLIEVDAFYLPDTAATSYRREHTKTTIGVISLDISARKAEYFHNAERAILHGSDYAGVFRLEAEMRDLPCMLPPYAEYASRREPPLGEGSLRRAALQLFRKHLSRRPSTNPISGWRMSFGADMEKLITDPKGFDHYAFNFPRQCGANFELLASHLDWLAPAELNQASTCCRRIAQTAKVVQFRLARAVARGRPDICDDCFSVLEDSYDTVISRLVAFA